MKILTWNINSVRLRLDLLLRLAAERTPDVICLQETKTPDVFFPAEALAQAGYAHQHFTGIKGYNGVAILSRHPLSDQAVHPRCGRDDARHVSARVKAPDGSFELHNVYIPAGGYEPDVEANEKFRHKLDFIDDLSAWFSSKRQKTDAMVVVGDLNVAPLEHDVWDSRKMQNVVSHTPIEREKFAALYRSCDWRDAARRFVPASEKLYTWWSYRAPDWATADKGRRLDHVWVTPPLETKLTAHETLKDARGWERPSDHVPVLIDLKMA